ncbi:hypothetical protein [Paenibacillus amylolyticus]|uniref:hypothetical protein n=1 Tax=Paenibacillus amylolyticus TaxID=1451 RepID=UPI003D95E4B2
MGRISVSLSDLRRAVQQCEQLQQRLVQQEQKMRTIAATARTTGTEDAYNSWKAAAGLGRKIGR